VTLIVDVAGGELRLYAAPVVVLAVLWRRAGE
jgi:hypothetical protein